MTIFLILAFLAVLLFAGWLWHCDRLNLRDEHAAEIADLRAEHAKTVAAKDATIAIGDEACESFAAKLMTCRVERDTARAGLQAMLLKEAREGLLKPHKPRGEVVAFERPKRGVK